MTRFWWTFVPMVACGALGVGLLNVGAPTTLTILIVAMVANIAGYIEGLDDR